MMQPLISANQINKTMGSKQLFDALSFGVFEGEKTGLIGSNGAGKSTLLRILAGEEKPDHGQLHVQKGLRVAFAKQDEDFSGEEKAIEVVRQALAKTTDLDAIETDVRASVYLSQAGFVDLEIPAKKLSGGWKKRLSIVSCIAQEPDLLILDEPTNHLDWDGILWLESWLQTFKRSLLLVSHDRAFLSNCTNRILEINRLYPDGYLSFPCNYDQFLLRKAEHIQAQLSMQSSLQNKARREVEWLRAGVQARTTKSRSRMQRAYDLLDDLQDLKSRNASLHQRSRIEIDTENRKTKKLIELKDFGLRYGDLVLLENCDLIFRPKTCWGLLGKNGSGKTSLLKAISQENPNFTGTIQYADDLKIVYFDQKREALPQDLTLVQFLGDHSDYVIFKNQSVHVASYASRFLFDSQKMHLKISQLSGGEQARLLIAKLLLRPADVLILDEPTNDLDIETIEILEDALSGFEGLVLLVSHDRYFLQNLCHRFLALEGDGSWAEYAEVEQWLRENRSKKRMSEQPEVETAPKDSAKETAEPQRGKLSKKDQKLLAKTEQEITKLEQKIEKQKEIIESKEIATNATRLTEECEALAKMEAELQKLFDTWESLSS